MADYVRRECESREGESVLKGEKNKTETRRTHSAGAAAGGKTDKPIVSGRTIVLTADPGARHPPPPSPASLSPTGVWVREKKVERVREGEGGSFQAGAKISLNPFPLSLPPSALSAPARDIKNMVGRPRPGNKKRATEACGNNGSITPGSQKVCLGDLPGIPLPEQKKASRT